MCFRTFRDEKEFGTEKADRVSYNRQQQHEQQQEQQLCKKTRSNVSKLERLRGEKLNYKMVAMDDF